MLRGGSVCLSLLYKYLTAPHEKNSTLEERGNNLKIFVDTFQSYGGVLAKFAQIICSDDSSSSVFSECKPYSQEKTIKYFQAEVKNNPNFFKNIIDIDFQVFKSGSVGQVHKAKLSDSNTVKDIIFKVQYVGLAKQIQDDMYLIDTLSSYLFQFANLEHALVDIKTKVTEEMDYHQESLNQQMMYNLWKDSDSIHIPQVYPELSCENILAMELIKGKSVQEFIANSTQAERNSVGLLIVKFIFENIYKHSVYYSDIHYGNFLVKDNADLYVTDFGCVIQIDSDLLSNIKHLHKAMLEDDKEYLYEVAADMGIINLDTITPESKEYLYDYFSLQYEPWVSDDFDFNDDWLELAVYKNTELMKEWVLPPNMVHFNKIPFGLVHILTKLEMECNLREYFKQLVL